jgi:hypothetical protein
MAPNPISFEMTVIRALVSANLNVMRASFIADSIPKPVLDMVIWVCTDQLAKTEQSEGTWELRRSLTKWSPETACYVRRCFNSLIVRLGFLLQSKMA